MFLEHQKNAHSNAKVNSYIDGTNLLVTGFIGDYYLILSSFSGIAHQDQVQPLQWQWQNYSFRELAPRNNPSSSLLSWQSMKTKACDSSPEADYILLACE